MDREDFIYELVNNVEDMIKVIEDRQSEEDTDDLEQLLDLAEQFRAEIESLKGYE